MAPQDNGSRLFTVYPKRLVMLLAHSCAAIPTAVAMPIGDASLREAAHVISYGKMKNATTTAVMHEQRDARPDFALSTYDRNFCGDLQVTNTCVRDQPSEYSQALVELDKEQTQIGNLMHKLDTCFTYVKDIGSSGPDSQGKIAELEEKIKGLETTIEDITVPGETREGLHATIDDLKKQNTELFKKIQGMKGCEGTEKKVAEYETQIAQLQQRVRELEDKSGNPAQSMTLERLSNYLSMRAAECKASHNGYMTDRLVCRVIREVYLAAANRDIGCARQSPNPNCPTDPQWDIRGPIPR